MLGCLSDGASGWSSLFVDGAGAFTWVVHGRLAWMLLVACIFLGWGCHCVVHGLVGMSLPLSVYLPRHWQ